MEKLARINPLIAKKVIPQLHSANICKLMVGLHYLASQTEDIEEGPNQNIINLAPNTNEYGPWELTPKWKMVNAKNWNETLRIIGFDTANAQRLKNILSNKLTELDIKPFTMKWKGDEYKHDLRGIKLIITHEITHDKRVKGFNIYVGGYAPIIKGWWQSVSPDFLHYDGTMGTHTWKFIIRLGTALRASYMKIKGHVVKHGNINDWNISMNMTDLEDWIGIADQSNQYKREAWKEIYTVMGLKGVALAEGIVLPKEKIKAYNLGRLVKKQQELWFASQGYDKFHHPSKIWMKDYAEKRKEIQLLRGKDTVIFHLTKKQLYEWLPIPELLQAIKEGKTIELDEDEYENY